MRFRTPLEIRNGIVIDRKMKATRLSMNLYMENGKIIIHPDKDGDIPCYDGAIDLTDALKVIGNAKYTICHHDIFGIIIDFERRG